MSERTTTRRPSARPPQKRRRRRKSTISISSYGGYDDDGDSVLKMFEEGEADHHFEENNNDEDEVDDFVLEDPRERRRREMEKKINEELLLQKLKNCKDIIENVKNQPWKMSRKLMIHTRARMYVEKHEGNLSRGKGYQHRGKQIVKQVLRSWKNWTSSLVPWEMKIKTIESHFGSVVASYFLFLRWLLWVSLWLAIMPACFIMIPEVLVGAPYGSSVRKKVPDDEVDTAYDLKTMWNADGIVKYSVLFYGYYGDSRTIGAGYRMPLAYLLTNMAAFAYSFVIVLKTMANNSRQNRMSNKGEQFTFAWKIFTEWDYMIGSQDTARTKHASIATTFKEAIMEEQEKSRKSKKWLTVSLRVMANVIIIILLALSTYVIQLFVARSRELEIRKRDSPNYVAGFWEENELTIIMTLIATIFPPALEVLSPLEGYHPRTSLRLMLARIFILNLLNLYTLFIALYNKQKDLREYLNMLTHNATHISNCSAAVKDLTTAPPTAMLVSDSSISSMMLTSSTLSNITSRPWNNGSGSSNCVNETVLPADAKELCWETMIGQEVFKLTILDTVFVLGQLIIQDVLRTYFVKHCNFLCCWDIEKNFPEYPEFKTAENILALISNQGVIWLGTFFNPGLPLLNLVKLLVFMYVRCWSVMTFSVPEERIFRASRSNNFYYALLLIMLFLCMLPPLFAIVTIEPSATCGPFSGHNRIYDVLVKTVHDELPSSVTSVIAYAASPGLILPVFMLLGMIIYYLVSTTRSLKDANSELLTQLEYERTEGRRKVYAMADAKHENKKGQGWKVARSGLDRLVRGDKKKSLADAASFLVQKLRTNSPTKATNHQGTKKQVQTLKDAVHAVQRNTAVPVAVIKGEQSVKAGGLRSRLRSKQATLSAFRKTVTAYAKQKKEEKVINENRDKEAACTDEVSVPISEQKKEVSQTQQKNIVEEEGDKEDEILGRMKRSAEAETEGTRRRRPDTDVFEIMGNNSVPESRVSHAERSSKMVDSREDSSHMDQERSSTKSMKRNTNLHSGKSNMGKITRSVSESKKMTRHASEDDKMMRHISEDDKMTRHASKDDKMMRHISEDDKMMKHISEDDKMMRHISEDDKMTRHISEGDKMTRHISEDDKMTRHISEGDKMTRHISEGDKMTRHISEGDKITKNASEGDKMTRHVSEEDKIKRYMRRSNKTTRHISQGGEVTRHVSEGAEITRHVSEGAEIPRPIIQAYEITGQVSDANRVKEVRRRLSSSSMVDESGHLKPYDELSDDDSDDYCDDYSDDYGDDYSDDSDHAHGMKNDYEMAHHVDDGLTDFAHTQHPGSAISRKRNISEKHLKNTSRKQLKRASKKVKVWKKPTSQSDFVWNMSSGSQKKQPQKARKKDASALLEIIDESHKHKDFGRFRETPANRQGKHWQRRTSEPPASDQVPEIKVEDFSNIPGISPRKAYPEVEILDEDIQNFQRRKRNKTYNSSPDVNKGCAETYDMYDNYRDRQENSGSQEKNNKLFVNIIDVLAQNDDKIFQHRNAETAREQNRVSDSMRKMKRKQSHQMYRYKNQSLPGEKRLSRDKHHGDYAGTIHKTSDTGPRRSDNWDRDISESGTSETAPRDRQTSRPQTETNGTSGNQHGYFRGESQFSGNRPRTQTRSRNNKWRHVREKMPESRQEREGSSSYDTDSIEEHKAPNSGHTDGVLSNGGHSDAVLSNGRHSDGVLSNGRHSDGVRSTWVNKYDQTKKILAWRNIAREDGPGGSSQRNERQGKGSHNEIVHEAENVTATYHISTGYGRTAGAELHDIFPRQRATYLHQEAPPEDGQSYKHFTDERSQELFPRNSNKQDEELNESQRTITAFRNQQSRRTKERNMAKDKNEEGFSQKRYMTNDESANEDWAQDNTVIISIRRRSPDAPRSVELQNYTEHKLTGWSGGEHPGTAGGRYITEWWSQDESDSSEGQKASQQVTSKTAESHPQQKTAQRNLTNEEGQPYEHVNSDFTSNRSEVRKNSLLRASASEDVFGGVALPDTDHQKQEADDEREDNPQSFHQTGAGGSLSTETGIRLMDYGMHRRDRPSLAPVSDTGTMMYPHTDANTESSFHGDVARPGDKSPLDTTPDNSGGRPVRNGT